MNIAKLHDICPDDWELSRINKACKIHNHLRKPINVDERKAMQGEYPYYGPTGILGYIDEYRAEGKFTLIGEDGDHFLKFKDKNMTLLVEGKFNVNNHAHILTGKKGCSTEWVYNFYRHTSIYPYLTRQGAGRYKLNKEALNTIPIMFPPLAEQEKIAEILGCWDIGIERVEKLIAAKQKMKKALMQQLLTGKKRFKEFDNGQYASIKHIGDIPLGWSVFKVGDCCDVLDNQRIPLNEVSRQKMKGDFPYYGANGQVDSINEWLFDEPLILIAEDGGNFQDFQERPIAYKIEGKSWVNNHAHILRPYDSYIFDWVYHQLRHKNVIPYVNGSTRGKLNQKDLCEIPLLFPKKKEEQQKIASVLNAADDEIDILQKKLDELKNQKKGLMQKLLTGKIRVKV